MQNVLSRKRSAFITGASSGIGAAIDEAAAKFGRLDSLINNAGIFSGGSIASLDLNDADRVFEVNVLASLRATRHATSHLKASGNGSVVFISSVAGHFSFAGSSVSCHMENALSNPRCKNDDSTRRRRTHSAICDRLSRYRLPN